MGCYFYFSVCCLWFVHAVCNENLTSGAWEVWCSKITPNWAWRKIWRDIIKGYPPIQNLQSSLYTRICTFFLLMLWYDAFPGSQDNCNAQPGFHLWWMYYARTWVFQSGIGSSKASCIKSQALPGTMHRYNDLVARCMHCMKVYYDMLIIYNDGDGKYILAWKCIIMVSNLNFFYVPLGSRSYVPVCTLLCRVHGSK